MPDDWNDLDHAGTVEALDAATTELAEINRALKGVASTRALLDTRQILVGKVRALQRRAAKLRPDGRLERAFVDVARATLHHDLFEDLKQQAEESLRNAAKEL